MKKVLCIIIIFTKALISFSQNIIDSVHPLFKGSLNGDLIREYYSFLPADESSAPSAGPNLTPGIFYSNELTVQLTQDKLRALGIVNGDNDFTIPVFDSSGVIVTVNGINKQNVANYQFRVLENKTKEKIPWHDITLLCEPYLYSFKSDGTEETEVAYLGEFKTLFGNRLTIEIRKKGDANTLKSVSAIWMNRAPSVLGIFSANNMQSFLSVFKKQWQQDFLFEPDPKKRLANDNLLRTRNNFAPGENSLIFYLDDQIKSKEVIEYNLVSGNRNSGWKPNDFDLNLVWLKNLSPGQYTLQIRYSLQRHNVSEYKFTIAPYWHQTIAFKIITATILLVILSLIIMLFKSRKQKQKLKWEQLQKQQVETELKSIRSQFNPHFVFNALSSIQGMITKNDVDGANKYLNEFSTLLRDSLKESSNEMVSLFTEIKMLESYLKLEQLRFDFTYSIKVDEDINPAATEIPVLLLQPLVENAVKHGVSSLYDRGILEIKFKKASSDMHAILSDNGKGFNVGEKTNGYGMKLTRDRIALFNKVSESASIEFQVNSTVKGTTVHLLFKNWLI